MARCLLPYIRPLYRSTASESASLPHKAFHAVVEGNEFQDFATSVNSRFVERSLWNNASRTRFPMSLPIFQIGFELAALLIFVVWLCEINQ